MNFEPKMGDTRSKRGRASSPQARQVVPSDEEELETGEPIPDEDEPKPVAKIPARGRYEARPVGEPESRVPNHSNSPNVSGGGQMVLSSAKYMKTNPEESNLRRGKKSGCTEPEEAGQSLEGRLLNAGVGGGLLAMGVAVVWFIAGLLNDYIFFYPPILFVIGLIAFFKGLASGDE